ncbi:hypothetical protein BGX28_005629 [Mortierella sp. GBA30]|nr:hypothetical protein BGX28_005629 [Mortierella sp. GBA30]
MVSAARENMCPNEIYNYLLQIDGIESITFSISSDSGKSCHFFERITSQKLKALVSPSTKVSKWQLHRKLEVVGRGNPLLLTMEIRVSAEALFGQLDPGSIEIHFIELFAHQPQVVIQDPNIRVHVPNLLSVDVSGKDQLDGLPMLPVSITFSGNGDYAVILHAKNKALVIELWDARCPKDLNGNAEGYKSPSFRSAPLAVTYVPLSRVKESKDEVPYYPFSATASWDASQIAVVYLASYQEGSPLLQDFEDIFGVYCSSNAVSYAPSINYRHCRSLDKFAGAARFHIAASENQAVENELFIASNGQEVQIYSVYGEWRFVRTIALLSGRPDPYADVDMSLSLIESLHGRHFLWYDQVNNAHVIWDIESGAVISYFQRKGLRTLWGMQEDAAISVSGDGSLMAFCLAGELTIYRTASGTLLRSCMLTPGYEEVSAIEFVCNNSQVLLRTKAQDDDLGRGTFGLILDVSTLTVEDKFSVPRGTIPPQCYLPDGLNPSLISAEETVLELSPLDDLTVQPYSRRHFIRHNLCQESTSPLGNQPTEFSSNGLSFVAQLVHPVKSKSPQDSKSPSVVVRISTNSGHTKTFTIPPLLNHVSYVGEVKRAYTFAGFLPSFSQLVVVSMDTLLIWGLPTTSEGDFVLLLAWSIPKLRGNRWVICPHQQLYNCKRGRTTAGESSDTIELHPDAYHPFSGAFAEYLLGGLLDLMEIFRTPEATCRKAIVEYVGLYINCYPVPDDLSVSVMSRICETWTPALHDSHKLFTAALLESARWVPRLDMDRKWNPLCILLEKYKKQPRAMGLAEIIVDYCLRQAREERDSSFLLPIFQCLDQLTDRKQQHRELALRTLQQLAYLPAKNRLYIIDNHIIAYPVDVRWKFWKNKLPPLYKCKDPVMQLMHNTEVRDPQNDNFTRGVYVASFDLLWRYRSDDSHPLASSHGRLRKQANGIQFPSPLSWANVLLQLVLLKCNVMSGKDAIECHDLELKAFDNPAIAALIEFKWNTIGYKYWLGRFLFQCCYYVLVLSAVFMQVYQVHFEALPGIFIAIIACAVIFLWLEVLQFAKDWKRYLSLIYNYVDLAAFGLPLAGSINQLVLIGHDPEMVEKGDSSEVLSFSILFIFLHIGGRYDSINKYLDSENYAFHTMMIIYFFFTVILMLNVLIALVNLAFTDGDNKWHLVWLENRLRYIEGAENLSFRVKGFRQAYNWFPNEIYYSATSQQVKQYTKRCFGDDMDDTDISVGMASQQHTEIGPPKTPATNPRVRSDAAATIDSKRRQEEASQRQKQSLEELKDQLRDEFKKELQDQLAEQRKEQQQDFEAQFKLLQEHMAILLKSTP